jgi:hypothetical protein
MLLFNIESVKNLASQSVLIWFLWGCLGLMTKETSFIILILIKSSCFFFLRIYFGLITWVSGPSTLDLCFIRLSPTYDMGCRFNELTLFFCFFLIDLFLFPISSFNIMFFWKLGFMICFGLFFYQVILTL